jgi:GAF domain-containing protein
MERFAVVHKMRTFGDTMALRPDLTEALARAAREIHDPHDIQSTLKAIVESAQSTLPGIDHVGISVAHRDGRMETLAGTGELVWELDRLQYELGEGPGVHALTTEPVVVINDLAQEQRWPEFVPAALKLGVTAQLGLRLNLGNQTLGGLNLYATDSGKIDPDVEDTAELFAVHAALVLGYASREEQLSTALATRKTIGQAVGIVMERYQLDEDRAFGYLVRVSQHSNTKLRDVAQELVTQGNERAQRRC